MSQSVPYNLVPVAATISQAVMVKGLLAFQITFMRIFDAETVQPSSSEAGIGVE